MTAAQVAVERLRAARDEVAELSLDALTVPELLNLLGELETDRRRQPTVEHRLIQSLRNRAEPAEVGAKNWADALATALRISINAARQRIKEAELLGPRWAMTGEPLAPKLPNVAAAQQRGAIGAEHVKVVEEFFHKLPAHIPADLHEEVESHLADLAGGLGPTEFRQAADRLAYLANQDGDPPNEAERARRRRLTVHRQDIDGMSKISGLLDPEARATLDAVFAKLAAPGMCDPDDEKPCVDGDPGVDQAHRDQRSQAQRNHDALKAMGRAVLASGELGKHNGLPATIIVSTTLQELEAGVGQGVTGGGSLLPMRDIIRLASHAHHYLVIYDKHTREPLYLGHTKRFASPGQRIVLHALDRGCTRPGCTAPGYWCQAHHVEGWAAENGPTDITRMTMACGPDNRLIENGGWVTRKRKDGRTEWIPPSHLDTGQARVNNYHHPEKYLLPEDDEGP
ncbi:MAG: HNH endonuclease [Mycobacteriaceae bacterium]|nr:HNH endonuclease [Mycobacteriaceae bacterium]